MTRQFLFAALFALAFGPAGTADAEPFRLVSKFSVDRPQERRPDPTLKGRIEGSAGSFYGGLNGRTLSDPDQTAAFDVFVGMRPRIGRMALDLGYSRRMVEAESDGRVAVGLGREVGQRTRFGARLQVNPEAEMATAEASASVRIFETTRIAGTLGRRFEVASPDDNSDVTLKVGASRPLGTGASMDLRYSDASSRAGRTELLMRLRF